jgi:hypothetical protein
MCKLQMWCPAPLPEGELHWRKLKSDKYKPPAGHLLEFYESDSSVEADEDTNAEAGIDPGAGVVKCRCRTRSAVMEKSASAVAAAISAVKAVEQEKKKRKRKAASPPAVVTPSIPTPHSWVLTRKVHSTPITQQAEQSWLHTHRERKTCESIFPEN